MWTRFYLYVISASLVAMGIGALVQRGYYDTRFARYIDLGPYHQFVGAALLAAGLLFGYGTYRSHRGE